MVVRCICNKKYVFLFQSSGHEHHGPSNGRQHTITINDTPSPAVSVITISDSEDEGSPGKKGGHRNMHGNNHSGNSHRKNVISCVTVGDSDNEENRSSAKVILCNIKSLNIES